MNTFLAAFSQNIKSNYTCYDRVILPGYILWMFSPANLINFLRRRGFNRHTNGVMRIFTDQLNSHIEKTAHTLNIPILWWPSVDGGTNGDKSRYVEQHYASKINKKNNHTYCIIADMESSSSYATRELTTGSGKPWDKMRTLLPQIAGVKKARNSLTGISPIRRKMQSASAALLCRCGCRQPCRKRDGKAESTVDNRKRKENRRS